MFTNLKGKKLLVLGASIDECQIVSEAQSMGVYTIVTDYHEDWKDSPAKCIADEAWNISWSDIEVLTQECIKNNVDGIMAGYSEFRIDCAIKLSRTLRTSFYAEDESVLEKTFNKQLFKDLMTQHGVPVPKDYHVDLSNLDDKSCEIDFPVVVKPVDNAGSRGICTSYSYDDLKDSVKYALSFSQSHSVVVEELVKGREVIAYYTMANGEIVLSAMCDKYERAVSDGFNSLPDVYFYPSLHLKEFVARHNEDVIKALKDMGMKNGSANLQGFIKPNGEFVFFEMDYRPGGTNTYHFTDFYSGENYLKMMIAYSLTGEADEEDLEKADPTFGNAFGCIFTLLSMDGTISEQYGGEIIASWPNILHSCFYHSIGTRIEVNGTQFPKTFRAYIVGNNIEDIKTTIRNIQKTIVVKNENGENMLFPEFDVEILNRYVPTVLRQE